MITHRSHEDAARIRRLLTAAVLLLLTITAVGVMVVTDDSDAALGTYTGGTNNSTMSDPYAGIDTTSPISGTIYVMRGGPIDIDYLADTECHGFYDFTCDYLTLTDYDVVSGTLDDDFTLQYIRSSTVYTIELIASDGGDWFTGGTPDHFSDDPYAGIDAPLQVYDRPIFIKEGGTVNFTANGNTIGLGSLNGIREFGLSVPGTNYDHITGTLTKTGMLDFYIDGEGYVQIWVGPIQKAVTGVKTITDKTMGTESSELDVSAYVENYSGSSAPSVRTLYSEVVSGSSVTVRDVDSAALAMTHVYVTPVKVGVSTIRVTAEDGSGKYTEFKVTVNQTEHGTLTYDASPGTGGPSGDTDSTYTGEFLYYIDANEPTRTGYTFMGWSETQGATVADYTYDERTNSAGESTSDRFWTSEKDAYLYAVWEKTPVKHTTHLYFEENGGSTVTDLTDSFESTEDGPFPAVTFTLPADPTREGYTFDGWALTATGSATYGHVKGVTTIPVDVDTDCTLYAKWTLKTITINLKSDANTVWTTLSGQYGSSVTIPESVPTKSKYACIGWATTVDAAVTDSRYTLGSSVRLSTDMDLYAVWDLNPQNYQLRFNLMSGVHDDYVDGQYVLSVDVKALNHVFTITAPEPSKEGYEFVGWATSFASDATVSYKTGDEYDMEGRSGAMLYAVYKKLVTFTLNFDANGGTGAPAPATGQSIEDVCPVTIPEAEMSWKKHDFVGWATTVDATSPQYLAGETVSVPKTSNPMTLYAVWVEAPTHFELVYDLQGGSIPGITGEKFEQVNSMEATHEFIIDASVPERVGFEFLGWSFDADATEPSLQEGDGVTIDDDTVTRTIYAVWFELNMFTITLDANGGQGGATEAVGYTRADECDVTLPSDIPSMSDATGQYLFEGWSVTKYEKNEGEAEYTVGSKVHMTERTGTLYAVWSWIEQDVTFTVHFDLNGGTGEFADAGVTVRAQSAPYTLPDIEPVNGDLHFLGWGYSADGRAEHQPGETITLGTVDTTLYAVWGVVKPYTLAFNVNGGVGNGTDEVTVDSAEGFANIRIPSKAPTFVDREYVVFLGWATDPAAVLPVYQPGEYVDVDVPRKVLYAVWGDDVFYTVSFHADGGIDPPMNIHGNSGTGSFTTGIPTQTPTMAGHHFLGWSTSAVADEPDYTAGQSFTTTVRDTVLYAVWGQDDVPDVTVTVDDVEVRVNGTFSTTVTAAPSGATLTVVSKEPWMSYADGMVTGTAPALAGDFSMVLRGEAAGYDPVLVTVRVTVMPNTTGSDAGTSIVFFNANGGELSSDVATYVPVGGTVGQPTDPVREGHTFVGWYDQYGQAHDFGFPVNGDLYLSAQWVEGRNDAPEDDGLSVTAIAAIVILVGIGAYLLIRRL